MTESYSFGPFDDFFEINYTYSCTDLECNYYCQGKVYLIDTLCPECGSKMFLLLMIVE